MSAECGIRPRYHRGRRREPMRMWGGRFGAETDERVLAFTSSLEVDRDLALDDLEGSMAHVRGLERAGLVEADEATELVRGIVALRTEVEAGTFAWDPALEDVHLNVEAALAERV